jgi:peptidoglycan hydrolase-like protein with peptidoglycan-binding domain
MSRSYSKIRHILEANQKLERRMLLNKGLLTENRSSYNSQNYLFEADRTLDIMDLQYDILTYEIEKAKSAGYVDDGSCHSAIKTAYQMGRNLCKVSGSTLCSDPNGCDQNTLIDGVYGPKTKAAYLQYKDKEGFNEQTNEDNRKTNFDIVATGQNIPVTMDQIKAFQAYYFIKEENQLCDESCKEQCAYRTKLCGGQCCNRNKAADGVWGKNTKEAWNEMKNEYLKSYNVNTTYQTVSDDYKNNTGAWS